MDCNDEPRRLYQKLVSGLKKQIESGDYPVGHKLPAERFLAEEYNVSRTVVREAIIILEAQGYVEVRKGSGIHVVNTQQQLPTSQDNNPLLPQVGPFELLQARQLIESNIAEFAATQATKQDIANLMYIQEQSRQEKEALNSIWDLKFHVQVALATQNSVMTNLVKNLWEQRINNPYWIKLHEHVGDRYLTQWSDDHAIILKALIQKDSNAAKMAMWQHFENTKQALFQATENDFIFSTDHYLFSENPVVHLNLSSLNHKSNSMK